MGNSVRITGTFVDGISTKLRNVGEGFDKAVGKGSSASFFGNIGAIGVAKGFGLIDRAGSAVIDLAGETFDIWQKVEQQEKSLNIALQAHGSSLDAIRPKLEQSITLGEQYGMRADDVREAVTKLTIAGLSFEQIQAGLPAVMDLAIAKHLSAADAADIMAKATTGNARGLADLGIKLTSASGKLTDTSTATDVAAAKGRNFEAVVKAITGATGDQSGSIDALDKKQTQLGNKWEKFATKIGPALESALEAIVDVLSAIVDAISWVLDRAADLGNLLAASPEGKAVYARKKQATPHQGGGWVGLNGEEIIRVGEHNPEYVHPEHGGGPAASDYELVPVRKSDISKMIDGQLLLMLQRAPATQARS